MPRAPVSYCPSDRESTHVIPTISSLFHGAKEIVADLGQASTAMGEVYFHRKTKLYQTPTAWKISRLFSGSGDVARCQCGSSDILVEAVPTKMPSGESVGSQPFYSKLGHVANIQVCPPLRAACENVGNLLAGGHQQGGNSNKYNNAKPTTRTRRRSSARRTVWTRGKRGVPA